MPTTIPSGDRKMPGPDVNVNRGGTVEDPIQIEKNPRNGPRPKISSKECRDPLEAALAWKARVRTRLELGTRTVIGVWSTYYGTRGDQLNPLG